MLKKSLIIFFIITAIIWLLLVAGIIALIIYNPTITKEYRQLKRVYRQYDRGYSFTKEELYEKLEGPFWVAFDLELYENREDIENNVLYKAEKCEKDAYYSANVWCYSECKNIVLSEPWKLVIIFDKNDKVVSMDFSMQEGG